MNLIAAVDNNWAIGKNNQLLVRIPMDQKFFREMTTGKVVVMGRKTLESFPNSRPLKNRTNIVLTHNPSYEVEGAVVVHSLDELHKELEKYNSEDIYIIGGQKIYEQLVDECDVGRADDGGRLVADGHGDVMAAWNGESCANFTMARRGSGC